MTMEHIAEIRRAMADIRTELREIRELISDTGEIKADNISISREDGMKIQFPGKIVKSKPVVDIQKAGEQLQEGWKRVGDGMTQAFIIDPNKIAKPTEDEKTVKDFLGWRCQPESKADEDDPSLRWFKTGDLYAEFDPGIDEAIRKTNEAVNKKVKQVQIEMNANVTDALIMNTIKKKGEFIDTFKTPQMKESDYTQFPIILTEECADGWTRASLITEDLHIALRRQFSTKNKLLRRALSIINKMQEGAPFSIRDLEKLADDIKGNLK